MIDRERRREVLAKYRPERTWLGEPMLGGWYTEEEIEAAVEAIRSSMDWLTGFGWPDDPTVVRFEREFAEYCGTEYCISINGAGTGLDMAVRCLGLEPGDEVIVPAINFVASSLAVIGQGGRWSSARWTPRPSVRTRRMWRGG